MNQTFVKDLESLNTALGFDPNSPVAEEGVIGCQRPDVVSTADFDVNQFWYSLTGSVLAPNRAKASEIMHPGMRLLHRFLVYHMFGKTELGNVATTELLALWLGTRRRNPNLHLPINYAEQILNRWIALRDSTTSSLELIMGGGIMKLAHRYVPNFYQGLVDIVGTEYDKYLDLETMISTQWLQRRTLPDGSVSADSWVWLVKRRPWLVLPNPIASLPLSQSHAPNPLRIAQDLAAPVQAPGIPEPPQQGQQRGGPSGSGPSSSGAGGAFDFSDLQAQMWAMQEEQRAQMRALQDEQRAQGVLLGGIYRSGVHQGLIEPYMNYPLWPPQEGPVPGWHNNAPTHPYHPHRPEGIDYRYPGGSDPRYDPNFPAWSSSGSTLSYPPHYHDSVPPMEQTWGNAPMPIWGNYSDPPSSTMDEDSE